MDGSLWGSPVTPMCVRVRACVYMGVRLWVVSCSNAVFRGCRAQAKGSRGGG